MERLVELLARVLISKGVEYAVAYLVAREQAATLANAPDSSCAGCDVLDACRVRERLDLDSECYAWDLPSGRN